MMICSSFQNLLKCRRRKRSCQGFWLWRGRK